MNRIIPFSLYIAISIVLIISIIHTKSHLKKYDDYFIAENGIKYHGVINEAPLFYILIEAQKFKNKLSKKKNEENLNKVGYKSHILPSKIIGFYGYLVNFDFFKEDFSQLSFDNPNQSLHDVFTINSGSKFLYLIIQKLFYLMVVFYFYLSLKKKIPNSVIPIFSAIFLLIEPSINQYHISFHGESIFFSLLILLLAILVNLPQKNIYYLLIGFLLIILMLQRSVSFLLPFVVILLTIIQYKKESYTKIIIIFLSYIVFILVIGFSNYKRSNNFYFMPWQTKSDLYDYLIPAIIKERDNLSDEQVKKILTNKQENFIIKKNLNINMEEQRYELLKFKQKYAFKIILQNKFLALKTIFINSLHSTLLNPVEQIFKSKYGSSYYKSDTHQKTIKYRIFYSVLLYSIILLGIITALKNKYYYTYPFLLISTYFFTISSWLGYTRYFTPVLLTLVIFFGIGSSVIYNKIKFKKLK